MSKHAERPSRKSRARNKPSIAEVAEHAGVSIATISRVINGVSKGKFSAETEARVRNAIAELGYRPVSVGRALRHGESRLVALLAANLANPAMAAIAASTEIALREAGFVMVLCDTHDDPAIQDEYLLEMRAQFASAIVLLGAVKSPQLQAFRKEGERLVFVNRRDPFGEKCPYVGIDNRRAGEQVADHFTEAGAKTLAVVHGPLSSSATEERVAGFLDRLNDRLPDNNPHIVSANDADHLLLGYHSMGDLIDTGVRPDAIFCLNDLIAFGTARRLREAGMVAVRDYSIVGFDDSPLNDWVAPWLTSVHVPYEQFGTAIVSVLKQRSSNNLNPEFVLKHHLIQRTGQVDRVR